MTLNLPSPSAAREASSSSRSGSRNTRVAKEKLTRCFSRFAAAFVSSHSKRSYAAIINVYMSLTQQRQAPIHLRNWSQLLPWPGLTKTTLVELRFNSIARWLPEAAAALRQAFDAEMARRYDAEDRRAEAR